MSAPQAGSVRARSRAVAAVAALVMVLMSASPAAGSLQTPTVPANLRVPTGHVLYLVGHARGYQIYTCQADQSGYSWVLREPWAGLVDDTGSYIALHYAGPTWRAPDGSAVVGARIASAAAPSGNAIPWLLLQATSTSGLQGGAFTSTTFIQRINTAGGLAPASGCDQAHVGATAAVFYTADYYFYRAG
jgi:hypothetical protein